jgi:hypothetical protein
LKMSSHGDNVRLVPTGRGAQLGLCCYQHHELKSIGRFWDHEIRDFLKFVPSKSSFD